MYQSEIRTVLQLFNTEMKHRGEGRATRLHALHESNHVITHARLRGEAVAPRDPAAARAGSAATKSTVTCAKTGRWSEHLTPAALE